MPDPIALVSIPADELDALREVAEAAKNLDGVLDARGAKRSPDLTAALDRLHEEQR
jgi:hypothetical protein